MGWGAEVEMGSLAGFLQFLGSGERLCGEEGTAESKGRMEGANLRGKS